MKKEKTKQYPKNYLFYIGVDEVGRGSLAGPLFVCAVALRANFNTQKLLKDVPLLDSKKLSPQLRKKWYDVLIKNKIPFVVAKISNKTIDKINIYNAGNLAAKRAILKLEKKFKIPLRKSRIILDGGLKVRYGETIIKADEKFSVVKIASILAKVKRDNLMVKLSKKYPYYFFHENKGYGTKKHILMIKKYGLSEVHRKTFCKFI